MLAYDFLSGLTRLSFVDEIWAYGSRARGDEQSKSDFDVAIVCPRATDDEWRLILDILEESPTLLKIDCVRFETLSEGKFKENLLRDKKILYSRGDDFMSALLWKESFESLGDVIRQLKEVLELPDVGHIIYLQDSAVKRFELAFELYWKILKKFLSYEKIICVTPREVLSNAYQINLIEDEKIWLAMLKDRNLGVHVYDAAEGRRVFGNLANYLRIMESTYARLQKRFEKMEKDVL